jgi:sugar lactone lactonase YvrE
MKNLSLLKCIWALSLPLVLIGCGAPPIPSATVVPSTSRSVPSATVSATETARPSLSIERIWGTSGNPNDFFLPSEIALDSQGNIYVIDGGNHRVQKYDKDGNFILMWGSQGSEDGQFLFNVPPAHYGAVTVDQADYVYVTDHFNRVQKFDSNGNFLMKFGGTGYADGEFATLFGVAVDDQGNIYTADSTQYEVEKFNPEGEFLLKWTVPSCNSGGISQPYGLAIDARSQLYVTNLGGNCIQKFDTEGNLLEQWGGTGDGDGQFYQPLSIALDRQGNIYVSDNKNQRVQVLDSTGNFLGALHFTYPVGLAVDNEGYLYVVEIVAGVLQKLRLQ